MNENSLGIPFFKDLKNQISEWDALIILLKYPMWNTVNSFFNRLRKFEEGLSFAEYSLDLVESNKEKLGKREFETYCTQLIFLKLNMMDCLNLWREYIEEYDRLLSDKNYYFTYQYSLERNDPVFNKFIVKQDNRYKYVHFLYLQNYVYEKIKRKLDKWLKWKNVEHLKKHQRDELSDEEIVRRYEEIMYFLLCRLNGSL